MSPILQTIAPILDIAGSLLFLLSAVLLALSNRRLRTRLTAAERESRRLSTDLNEYLGRLRRAELQGDGLCHRLNNLRDDLVQRVEAIEGARTNALRDSFRI